MQGYTKLGTDWTRDTRNEENRMFKELYDQVGNVVQEITEEVINQIIDDSRLNWLPSFVDTYEDIATTYPNPSEGDTTMQRNDSADYPVDENDKRAAGTIWRFDGTAWEPVMGINPSAITGLETTINDKLGDLNNLTTQDKTNLVASINETNNKMGNFSQFRSNDTDLITKMKNEFTERGVNVKWFGASGSDQSTTGSITTGSNELTVVDAIDFEVGQGILIEGAGQDGGNLVTSITAINGTVFTLADGASADVTNVNVKHDDTIALQSAINTGKNVFWSSGNYNFDVLTLSIDNIVITFDKDVVIKSENKQDNLATGAFEIKGTTAEETNLSSDATEDNNYIEVDNASIFSIGDFIELSQNDPEGDTLEIHKQKYIRAILSVKEINGNIITVNEVLPHSFQVSNSAKARLINPVKNIRINGNNTIFDKMGTTEYCSHFLVKYAYNTKINGFECINGGGKGVDLFGSYTFKVDDITHSNPTNVTPGHGYGVHIGQGSSFGEVNDVKSRDARHCVDISGGSNNCRINNSTSFSASSSAFSGHGMNTKNIVFSNCVSYGSAFSVGNSSFLSDEKYKFINCEVYNSSGGFSVVAQSSDVEIINCKTLNCETAIFAADGTEKINLYNTEINFSIVGGLDLQSSHVSGENIRLTDSIIKIRGNANEIELKNIISNERVEIYDNAKNITISGLKLRGNPTRGLLVSGNVQFLNLFDSDCDLESTSRVIDLSDVTVTDIHLKIINSNIKTNGSTAVLCGAKNVYLINNNIQGSVSLSGDGDYTLMSNLTSGNISITSTTTTLIKDNISTSGSWTVPTDNGNDLIVKDNII